MPSDTPLKSAPPERWKFRVRFAKSGHLRLVSHHDLMHVMERMFRRADLVLATSQGFNPRPKMTFALSLPLGVSGLNEVLEIETAAPLGADDVQARFTKQCPPGMQIHSVRSIDFRASGRVRRALYALSLPEPIDDLPERIQLFLAGTECWMERARPHARRINVRPYVDELSVNLGQARQECLAPQTDAASVVGPDIPVWPGPRLTMALWITPYGAARADEIVTALGLRDLLEDGAVIERTDLELCDEMPPGTPDAPVIRAALQETTVNDEPLPAVARPTAIMDSPMSFDS